MLGTSPYEGNAINSIALAFSPWWAPRSLEHVHPDYCTVTRTSSVTD